MAHLVSYLSTEFRANIDRDRVTVEFMTDWYQSRLLPCPYRVPRWRPSKAYQVDYRGVTAWPNLDPLARDPHDVP